MGFMRLLLCALALLSLACSDPARVARQTVDRTSRALLQADAGTKRVTRQALMRIAAEEGTKRGQEMRAAGCSSAAVPPPAGASQACLEAARVALERYHARCAAVTAAAGKVDRVVGLGWNALALVVDVLQDLDAGLGPQPDLRTRLAVLLQAALKTYADAVVAYQAFRDLQGSQNAAGATVGGAQ